MRIGLIDVDGHNFPNLPLMKISAWHKAQGDSVEWYEPLIHGYPAKPMDIVYKSKVFSFSSDYQYYINAIKIIGGGSGTAITLENGKEIYRKECDQDLPYEIEHIYPDYSIYYEKIPKVRNTAYGFMTRGCPRGCNFCHVAAKEGKCSRKVADLSEFWKGQENIVLLDPNPTACREWKDNFQQLIDSGAYIDFSQGVDIRTMTEEKALMIKQMKVKRIHFAFDRYEDKDKVLPKLKEFMDTTGWNRSKVSVYVLCNFNTTIEQDLFRISEIRKLNAQPYVMLYDKEHLPKKSIYKRLQRWCNNKIIFETEQDFMKYKG